MALGLKVVGRNARLYLNYIVGLERCFCVAQTAGSYTASEPLPGIISRGSFKSQGSHGKLPLCKVWRSVAI